MPEAARFLLICGALSIVAGGVARFLRTRPELAERARRKWPKAEPLRRAQTSMGLFFLIGGVVFLVIGAIVTVVG